mgnify:CR=1 FL=1
MNILHVIEDYSTKSGGLRTVLSDLNSRLNTQDGVNSFIISSQKEDQDNTDGLQMQVLLGDDDLEIRKS